MSDIQRWIAPDFGSLMSPAAPVDTAVSDDTAWSEELSDEDVLAHGPTLPTLDQISNIETAAHNEGFARGLEEGREQGLQEGREQGHAEGLAASQGEMRRLIAQIEGIVDNFSRPLARLEDEVTQALGEMAVRIAGALIGRAYTADPSLLAALVQQAVAGVPPAQRPLQIRLHPDDVDLLLPLLALPEGCDLVPDTTLARGDLRVHAEAVRIDGSLQARLQAALTVVQEAEPSA